MRSHSMYPKVGYFWYRYPKYPIWGTKWGTKLEIFQKKFSPQVCPSYSFQSQPWTINENFIFSFRFIRGYIKFVPQKCGTFMFVPHVPQMWYKCGTKSSTLNLIDFTVPKLASTDRITSLCNNYIRFGL